ncbi:MAG: hypothetical protein H8F28_07195 [Fibrella sp.]|nr:hypothetical protein [Armatimonadota bacterium]
MMYTYVGSYGTDLFRLEEAGIGTPPDTLENLIATAALYVERIAAGEYLAARAARNPAPSFMGFHTHFHGSAVIGGPNVLRTILFSGGGGPVYTPPEDDTSDDDLGASRLVGDAADIRHQFALVSLKRDGVVRYDEGVDDYVSGCSWVSPSPIPAFLTGG